MANVSFKKGLLASLPSTYAAGTFYVTTDERAMYLDIDNSTRIRIGDFQEFATLDALKANVNPSTSALYYISGLNVLAKWNGTDYVQINLDTGATSFEAVGDGNAVTSVSYDPATRKLTLTKGETFATAAELSEADEAIRKYVDEKTSGIATDAALGELQDKVTEAEKDIEALQADSHTHENDEVLDGITAELVADWNDAVSKEHEHANKAELDLIVSGDKAKWDKAVADLTDEIARAKAAEEANAAAAKAADDKAVAAQGAVDALAGKVGTVPADKTVVQMISDAQTAATYDDTKVKEDITANAEAIALLNDASTVVGSVDYKIAQAVASIIENPDETMNSINELVTWCNDHADDALALSNQVSTNKDDIAALEALVGETKVADQITAAIAGALKIEGVDKYALASDLTAAIARIAAMEAKVANWDAAEKNAKDHADSLNNAMNARVEALEAVDHDHANKAELDKIADGDVAKWNAAQANAEATAAAALSGAKTELEGKIANAQAAAEKVANDNNTAMDTRVKVLEAIDHEAYKGYADQAEADAVATANAYADSLVLTWGDF